MMPIVLLDSYSLTLGGGIGMDIGYGMAEHMTPDTGEMRPICYSHTYRPGDEDTTCHAGPHRCHTWEERELGIVVSGSVVSRGCSDTWLL